MRRISSALCALACACNGPTESSPVGTSSTTSAVGATTGATTAAGGGGSGLGGSGGEGPEPLPGPLPGWEREFDGITCVHPAVEADCENGWCRIPPGCFIKGSPPDEPGHPAVTEQQRAVVLTHGFWMKQHEVTQGEWTALGLVNPSGPFPAQPGGDCTDDPLCPVGRVTWWEALAYANLRSETHRPPLAACYELSGCTGTVGADFVCEQATPTTGAVYACEGYRLPTDAEFEYAIRASTSTAFYFGPFGEDVPTGLARCDPYQPLMRHAWYCANSDDTTRPAGTRRPNAWHLYDMAGNAREWVYDTYTGGAPPPGPLTDPTGPTEADSRRRVRSGSVTGWPELMRSAAGLGYTHSFRSATTGFRLVRTIPADPERAAEGP